MEMLISNISIAGLFFVSSEMLNSITRAGFAGISLVSLVALLSVPLFAQDEVRVTSPNGQIEFRVGTAQPEGDLPGLAYQIHYRGKPVINTSFMGFDVLHQEPMLGEKV